MQCMPLAEPCYWKVVILYSNDCIEIGLEGLRNGHHRWVVVSKKWLFEHRLDCICKINLWNLAKTSLGSMNIFLDQIITPSKVFKNFKIKFMEGKGCNLQNLLSKQNFCLFLKKKHPFSQFLKQALNVYPTMARTYPCNLSLKIVTNTIQLHNTNSLNHLLFANYWELQLKINVSSKTLTKQQ